MDSLMRLEKMMQQMAHHETDACGTARQRLEKAIASVSSVLMAEDADQGYMEALYASLVRETEHYDRLIARAEEQLLAGEHLAPAVRDITVPLLEQLIQGYLSYRAAWQALCEGLYYGLTDRLGLARDMGNTAVHTVRDTWKSLQDDQYELPLVA